MPVTGLHVINERFDASGAQDALLRFQEDCIWQVNEPAFDLSVSDTVIEGVGHKPITITFVPPANQKSLHFTVSMRKVIVRGVTLRVAGGNVALAMADCTFAGSPLGLLLADRTTAVLERVAFQSCGTAAHATSQAHLRMDSCNMQESELTCIKAFQKADVALSDCVLSSRGKCCVRVATGAVFNASASEITAISSTSTAIEIRGGASATVSASWVAGGGLGVHCVAWPGAKGRSRLRVWDSLVHGRKYAIRARHAWVEIWDECQLEADEHAALALEAGCALRLEDSVLCSGGPAALVAVKSRVDVQRTKLECPANPESAGIVLNRVRSGSVLLGNSVIGPERHVVFVHARAEDRRAMRGAEELLQHRRLPQCDVQRALCAAHSRDHMMESTPVRTAMLCWLRELGACEETMARRAADAVVDGAADTLRVLQFVLRAVCMWMRRRCADVLQMMTVALQATRAVAANHPQVMTMAMSVVVAVALSMLPLHPEGGAAVPFQALKPFSTAAGHTMMPATLVPQ